MEASSLSSCRKKNVRRPIMDMDRLCRTFWAHWVTYAAALLILTWMILCGILFTHQIKPSMVNARANDSPISSTRSQMISRTLPPKSNSTSSIPNTIDLVYTFVNGTGPAFVESIKRYEPHYRQNKFREWGELKYSMRSVNAYAPWIRHIYIVIANQHDIPNWLNTSDPRIKLVYHEQIFDDPANQLPTYNSYVIESFLHRIPGLSENYLYMNNDFFLGRSIVPDDFMDSARYYRYMDYPIIFSLQCRRRFLQDSINIEMSQPVDRCAQEAMYIDSVVAKHYFDVTLTRWYLHAPRMYNKEIMFLLEKTLNSVLQKSRLNHLRKPESDINIHLQYESLIASRQWKRIENIIVSKDSPSIAEPHRLYVYVVFMNHDGEQYYSELQKKIDTYHPKFIAIDDDLKDPPEAIMQFHKQKLTDVMQRYWSKKAEWEL